MSNQRNHHDERNSKRFDEISDTLRARLACRNLEEEISPPGGNVVDRNPTRFQGCWPLDSTDFFPASSAFREEFDIRRGNGAGIHCSNDQQLGSDSSVVACSEI